jgi:hypothetical protein
MDMSCGACGARFRSMIAEAKHRHNFPVMCKRNKRFIAWTKARRLESLMNDLARCLDMIEFAMPVLLKHEDELTTIARATVRRLPGVAASRALIEVVKDDHR